MQICFINPNEILHAAITASRDSLRCRTAFIGNAFLRSLNKKVKLKKKQTNKLQKSLL
jgi:hypothetical protein